MSVRDHARRRAVGPGPDPAPAGAVAVRAVRDVRRAGRRRAPARGRPRHPVAAVHLPAVLPAVRLPGRASWPTARCPTATWRSSTAAAAGLGRPAAPGRRGVLLRQLRARPGGRRSTRARPARPSPSCRWTPGTRCVAAAPALATLTPDVEALLVRTRGPAGSEAFLVPIDVCYELVGAAAQAAGAGSTAARTSGGGWTSSSTRCGLAPAGGAVVTDARLRPSSTWRRSRTRRRRTLLFRLRVDRDHRRGRARDRAARASCGSSRSAARTTTREQEGLADLFGTPDRWSQHAASRSCGPTPSRWCRASPGASSSTCRSPARTTSRSAATKYLHALRDGDVPLRAAVQRHGVHPRRHRLRGRAGALAPGGARAGCRCAVWRALMDLYFPGGGWIRLDRDTLDALARYRSARGLTSAGSRRSAELLPAEVPAS